MTPALLLIGVLIAAAGYAVGYRDGHADATDQADVFDRELSELLNGGAR